VFTFIPESCSRSSRNTVRNHPGIAFILPRIPHRFQPFRLAVLQVRFKRPKRVFVPLKGLGRDVMEVTALLNEEFLKFKKVHGKRYFAPPCLW
jgi:hypothetical protein